MACGPISLMDNPDKSLEVGLEDTPELYVDRLVSILREVRRVLRKDGVLWLNLGTLTQAPGKGDSPQCIASTGNQSMLTKEPSIQG